MSYSIDRICKQSEGEEEEGLKGPSPEGGDKDDFLAQQPRAIRALKAKALLPNSEVRSFDLILLWPCRTLRPRPNLTLRSCIQLVTDLSRHETQSQIKLYLALKNTIVEVGRPLVSFETPTSGQVSVAKQKLLGRLGLLGKTSGMETPRNQRKVSLV